LDRKQKEQKVLREDGKVFEIRDLKVQETYRDPNYTFVKNAGVIEGMGRLDVFTLRPASGIGLSFIGRWDGGSRDAGKTERYDLDIDLEGVSKQESKKFKHEEGGYSGHHAVQMPSAKGRAYKVAIRAKNQPIFEGTVSFCTLRKMGLAAGTAGFAATLNKSIR
jgi:hypothetical protein